MHSAFPNDPDVVTIAKALVPDGSAIQVPIVCPNAHYKGNYCWYNAAHHAKLNRLDIVFGWAIWGDDTELKFQHHAVCRNADKSHIDVTPNPKAASGLITFLPDPKRPFDFERLRCFYNCVLDRRTGRTTWEALGDRRPAMSIARIKPTQADIDYFRDITPELELHLKCRPGEILGN
jgi:hypothetical protein